MGLQDLFGIVFVLVVIPLARWGLLQVTPRGTLARRLEYLIIALLRITAGTDR